MIRMMHSGSNTDITYEKNCTKTQTVKSESVLSSGPHSLDMRLHRLVLCINLPVVETANLHVPSTKDFQEDVRDGLDLVLGKHSCVHLKLQSSLREGRGRDREGGYRETGITGGSNVHLHTLGVDRLSYYPPGTYELSLVSGLLPCSLGTRLLSTRITDSVPLFLGPERKVSCLCENSFLWKIDTSSSFCKLVHRLILWVGTSRMVLQKECNQQHWQES